MTPAEERILDALVTYRFVIRDQMHTLGVCRDRKHLGDLLRRLQRQRFVGEMKPVRYPGAGRLPAMWYLTAKGAKRIEEYRRMSAGSVPYTKGRPEMETDRQHRKACVDFHIALVRWAAGASVELDFYIPYYVSGGSGRTSTRVELSNGQEFKPDAIFGLKQAGAGEPDLFAVEFSTIREAANTKHVRKKLETHWEAMVEGSIGDKLGIPRNNRVLCVFEEERGLQAVRKRAADNAEMATRPNLFWFATLDELLQDFPGSWVSLFGEPVSF